jgi:glycosyltransferase involved in cell wall biosynthesis
MVSATKNPMNESVWTDHTSLPCMSIVVIGRNEGERLTRCFESIRAADYPQDRLELIYVDSASMDNSCEQAKHFGAHVIRLTERPFSAARARNIGWRQARYELVHFFDGDVALDPRWLKKAVARIQDPQVACVFGRREEVRPQASIYMRVCAFDWYVPEGPWRICGGDALFQREILEQLGGFNEEMIAGEEPELSYRLRRLGLLVWRLNEPMTRHDLNMTRFGQYWKRLVRSGWAYAVVAFRCRHGKERFWQKESLFNALELFFWVGTFIGAGISGFWWALLLWFLLLITRVTWIARKARPNADGWTSAYLYGFHCVFSRLPLFIGQLKGLWHVVSRNQTSLMEYNTASQQ